MPTPLTPNSAVVRAIATHLETGIPISAENFNLSPDEVRRIRAVFKLYKTWRKNPLVDKKVYLKEVFHRRTTDIPNDLYCFEFIKGQDADLMLSKEDLLRIQQSAILSSLQAAQAIGDPTLELKAAKELGNFIKEMPETQSDIQADQSPFYTSDIRQIAPDFIPVDSPTRARLLKKYGGKPDANTQLVEEKVAAIKKNNKDIVTITHLTIAPDTPKTTQDEPKFPDME